MIFSVLKIKNHLLTISSVEYWQGDGFSKEAAFSRQIPAILIIDFSWQVFCAK